MIRIVAVDENRMAQRHAFLRSRAEAHAALAGVDDRHRMCAAMLWRDAGCVALFQCKSDAGCMDLTRGGNELVRLGVAAGWPLIALADGPTSDRLSTFRAAAFDLQQPLANTVTASPRQLLSCLQAGMLMEAHDGSLRYAMDRLAMEVRNLELDRTAVGETGLSIADYVEVGTAAIRDDPSVRDRAGAWFAGLCDQRTRDIESAAEDSYHWRLMARPAELLDLDSVILLYILRSRQVPIEKPDSRHGTKHRDLVLAPLTVAERLLRTMWH